MSDDSKEKTETKVEGKPEIKFPQISSQLRGEYSVFTKDKGVFNWDFPYQSSFEDSLEAINIIKEAIDKTIIEKKEAEKNQPNKVEGEYTPVDKK